MVGVTPESIIHLASEPIFIRNKFLHCRITFFVISRLWMEMQRKTCISHKPTTKRSNQTVRMYRLPSSTPAFIPSKKFQHMRARIIFHVRQKHLNPSSDGYPWF
ncbi:hypothetical protein V3481_008081 [Fusarium oxysporum f. sp. vasinfectum]